MASSDRQVRIVSLLPSATEIIARLGLFDSLRCLLLLPRPAGVAAT